MPLSFQNQIEEMFEKDIESVNYLYNFDDIAEYGLFAYEEFAEKIDIPEGIFDAFDGQYLKIAIGKGLTTMADIAMLIQRYAELLYAI